MPFTFLTYLLYILRNCSFCITTPSFHKWVKNDPHAFSMESNGNLWFLSTVAVRNKLTVDHTDYIRSFTPQEDYFTQQELIRLSIHIILCVCLSWLLLLFINKLAYFITAWELFITDDIIQEVMKCTNLEGRRVATARGKEWKNVTKDEFMAFIGLTLLAWEVRSEKNWDVSVRELFGSPLHNPMYKATMAVGRFEDIRRTLRFDDKRTRAFRLETDHMAAFRYVWDLFLVNCRQFIPSDCVTVDEQLVPFRGRCKFLQYMPSKPAKYGLKIFWVCDARIPYAIDGIVYTGRQPGEEVQKNLGENIVQQLCSRFRNTGRNITMDNFFTSVPLAQHLLEKDLTIVGTLRQNKPDIPPLMKPSKSREVHSTEFGFNDSLTMVSYVRKKGKAVVLSTMHHDKVVDENSRKKKPEVITFYNKTKGGVDRAHQRERGVRSAQVTKIAKSTIGVGNAMYLCAMITARNR